ncbi:hypothetical protein J7J90_03920 [Candidatus Micrarchaeota archaeon]|nr:hypothetical protein [Candidatus Micrarchaeota archaeon]
MTQGVKLAENISGVEIANIIKSKNSEIGNVNNLNIFIDALIQRMTKLHDEARKHNEEGIFPDIPKTNEGFADMFIESFNKAKKIINDPLNHEALKNHMGRELTDEEVLKLTIFIAGNILLYGENGIAAVKGSFGLLPNDNTFNSVLSTVNQRISFYFTTIYDLKEVWENIQGKLKNSFDPVDAVALLTLKTEEKKREKIEYVPKKITEHEEKEVSPTVKHKKPSVKEKPKKEETTETKAPISEELANETIEQMYIIENYLTPSQLADLGYLQNTQDLVRIYSDTDLIFSPGMIAGFEKQLEEKGLSPQGEGVFGRVGLNKYHLEEAILYATGYLEELWGVPNLVLWENDDERKALQQLIINLGIYDYMNGKGELKELFDGATGDELRKVFSNGRINMDALNDINKRVLNAVPEQQQFVMFIANQIFSDEEKNRTSVIREYNQLTANTDAMEILNLYPTGKDLELVSSGRPLIYNKDEKQIYALTEERKTLFSENVERLAQGEITWQQFVNMYQKYYGAKSAAKMMTELNITYYGNTPINKGGHGEYPTIGSDILLNYTSKGNPYLQGTNIIKKHWKEATKGLGDKWDGSVSMIGEWILQNVKLNKADRTELENAIIFYKAVEKGEINNYTWKEQKIKSSPIDDLYYSVSNYTEKWQDMFDQGLFTFAESLGWVKITKDKNGKWTKVEIKKEEELNKVLTDPTYMLYLSYAFEVLGQNAAAALHNKYGKEWIQRLKTKPGRNEIINFLGKRYGANWDAKKRINGYIKGSKNLTRFMDDLNKILENNNIDPLNWAEVTNKLRTDEKLRNELTNIFVTFLQEKDYASSSLMFPLYFRFYEFGSDGKPKKDKSGNYVVKRDVVEEEVMKILDPAITDGFNPLITLGFLITGNTYENDYTESFHWKKKREYTVHFDLAPNGKIIPEIINVGKQLGFDGRMDVEKDEDVIVTTGKGHPLKWRNVTERELIASMDEDTTITEIQIKDRKNKKSVMADIDTQTLLQVTAQTTKMNSAENGTQTIRTPDVKDAEVTLYFSKVEKDGTLTFINVPIKGNLTTDEHGRSHVTFNINQKDENGDFIFEDGAQYVISGRTGREDLGSSHIEHIATFKVVGVNEITPTVKGGVGGVLTTYIPETPLIEGHIFNGLNPTIAALDPVWGDGEYMYKALEALGADKEIIDANTTRYSYAGDVIEIGYDGTTYNVNRIRHVDQWYDIETNPDPGVVAGPLLLALSTGLLNSYRNDDNPAALDAFIRTFVNDDMTTTEIGQHVFTVWSTDTGVTDIPAFRNSIIDSANNDEIYYYLLNEDNPELSRWEGAPPQFMRSLGNSVGLYLEHSTFKGVAETRVARVNNVFFSLPLLQSIQRGGWLDIEAVVALDVESGRLYIVEADTELPEELRDRGEYDIYHIQGSLSGEFKISERIGMTTSILADVPAPIRKRMGSERANIYGFFKEAVESTQGSSVGLQHIVSGVLNKNIKPFVGAEVDYVLIGDKKYGVVGVGGGAELYLNDLKLTLSYTEHRGLKGSEPYANVDMHSFIFTIDKPVDKGLVDNLKLRTEATFRDTYRTGKMGVTIGMGPAEVTAGATATQKMIGAREIKPGVYGGVEVSLDWIWKSIIYPPLDWIGIY